MSTVAAIAFGLVILMMLVIAASCAFPRRRIREPFVDDDFLNPAGLLMVDNACRVKLGANEFQFTEFEAFERNPVDESRSQCILVGTGRGLVDSSCAPVAGVENPLNDRGFVSSIRGDWRVGDRCVVTFDTTRTPEDMRVFDRRLANPTTASACVQDVDPEELATCRTEHTQCARDLQDATVKAVAPPVVPPPVVPPPPIYKLVKSLDSVGRCLDRTDLRIGMADCHGGQNQQWAIDSSGHLLSQVDGRCIDVQGGSLVPADCQQAHQFVVDDAGRIQYSGSPGDCASVTGVDGVALDKCKVGSNAQMFRFDSNEHGDRMVQGQSMLPGSEIRSEDGRFRAVYDGDLKVMEGSRIVWSSNTSRVPIPGKCVLQADSNLVLYDADGKPYWFNHGGPVQFVNFERPCVMRMDEFGVLLIVDAVGKTLWRSRP